MGETACNVMALSVFMNDSNKQHISKLLENNLEKILSTPWLRRSVWYLLNQLATDN